MPMGLKSILKAGTIKVLETEKKKGCYILKVKFKHEKTQEGKSRLI